MGRARVLLTTLLVVALAATGLASSWMRHLLEPVDEFSAWNHPWQGTVEALHLFLGPFALLLLGAVGASHAVDRWRAPHVRRRRRVAGALLGATLLVTLGVGAWMLAWPAVDTDLDAWVHGIAGGLFAALYLVHARGA